MKVAIAMGCILAAGLIGAAVALDSARLYWKAEALAWHRAAFDISKQLNELKKSDE